MIVLDTNIIISALIKDSITRKIIIESSLKFVYPEMSFYEILKYKPDILRKSGYNIKEFEIILFKIFEYITLIPLEVIKSKLQKAKDIMGKIDINDVVFVATALAVNNPIIWSDDSDFDKQKTIKILKTKDMVKLFEKL
jgi:predicted nucleic acid-binding protein